ncbi:MAG: M23 family metallopeptidase [Clostridia bacterium]|nr:M23 family metallopeptidase [Clostridia bacterium]
MENNRDKSAAKSDKFFAGKGFYIVLFLCVAVIAASVWALLSGPSNLNKAGMPELELQEPAENFEAEEETADSGSEYETAMWEVPEDAEEVLVEAEAPQTVAEAASLPETHYENSQAFIWPVIGELEMPYSVDTLVYDTTMCDWRTHDGVDIAGPLGGKVMAAASGSVAEIYGDPLYGTTVVIDHGDGLRSIYANLAEVPAIKVGDAVLAGETIGAIGTTALCEIGETTHLHFRMTLNGESVDPNDYLPAL